jgi:acetoin utilization deacetylase AcuC-like enzyme
MYFLYDDVYLRHDVGAWHPERPERLTAVYKAVRQAEWYGEVIPLEAQEASLESVSLAHDPRYIELVQRECEAGYRQLSTGDTAICPGSYAIALKAAGGILKAVDGVMAGEAKTAFCAVRPPGHHASSARGMGFCVFNNIAIAARYAQDKYGIERVLIADWDVHHGNGTQNIFYRDGSVLFMSTHQWPFYPGTGLPQETGEGPGEGFTINRPFPAGAGNEEIVAVFKDEFLPAAREFKPELTLLSAGFDSRIGDLIGGFRIDDDGFRQLTHIVLEMAHIAGQGRLISILEGGYHLAGMAAAAAAHMEELIKA